MALTVNAMASRGTTKLAVSVMWVLAASAAHAQKAGVEHVLADQDAAARYEAQTFAERARVLSDTIAKGWTMAAVRAVMGEPERVQRRDTEHGSVEIWGYQGFDVRVEFRDGRVD